MKKGLAALTLAGALSLGVFGSAFADVNDFTSSTPSLSGSTIGETNGFLSKGLGDKGYNVVIHVTYTASQNYSITTTSTETITEPANAGSNASETGLEHAAVITRTITVSSTQVGEQTVGGNTNAEASKTNRTNKQAKTTGYYWNQGAISLPDSIELPDGAVATGSVTYSNVSYTVDVEDASGKVVSFDSDGDGTLDTQYLKTFDVQ